MAQPQVPRDDVRKTVREFISGRMQKPSADTPGVRRECTVIFVENRTGWTIPRGCCVIYNEPAITPEKNLDAFIYEPTFQAIYLQGMKQDNRSARYGVALEPIPRNGVGRVCVSGVCTAIVRLEQPEISRETDRYCNLSWFSGDTGGFQAQPVLLSGLAGGTQILYLSEESPSESNTGKNFFWAVVRLGVDAPVELEVELLEDMPGYHTVQKKAQVLRAAETTDLSALEWLNKEQWYEKYPPEDSEESEQPWREIKITKPAWFHSGTFWPKGKRLTVRWYPQQQRWIPVTPDDNFYGIPPENTTGYTVGSVFEATGNWDPRAPYVSSDKTSQAIPLYVAGQHPTGALWQPSVSLWVIQEYVPAGSREPVVIKKIDDPSSVRIRTTESVSDNTVKHSDSTPIRYSLNAGDTAMTRYNGERPVWVCQEHGRLVYSRFGIYEARVTSIYAGIYVSTNDTSYQDFSDLQVTPPNHYAANQQPDIYAGDVVTVEIDFENIGSTYSGRIINCPMDEKPGSIRTLAASAPSPGRGWTQDSDVTLKTSTDGTYRLINWKKKAPEAN